MIVGLAVDLKYYPYIGRDKTAEGFFDKGALVLFQVLRGEGVGNADYELVIPVTQSDRFFQPGPIVRFADLNLEFTQRCLPDFLRYSSSGRVHKGA